MLLDFINLHPILISIRAEAHAQHSVATNPDESCKKSAKSLLAAIIMEQKCQKDVSNLIPSKPASAQS